MHKPVLLQEVVHIAEEIKPHRILDGTFGRGGHTTALLNLSSSPQVTAIDQDEMAIAFGKENLSHFVAEGRLQLLRASFHALPEPIARAPWDLILLDLGVSSPQLDAAARGFSFYHDGPLDMRMDQLMGVTAAEIVNDWPEVELYQLFQSLGEIPRPQRVVRAIVNDRRLKPFTSTLELSGLIERVEGWRRKGHHPATNYFLALRLMVNNELEGLKGCLPTLMNLLSPKGRLVIITFHSLEDRIIKYAFKEAGELGYPLYKKVVVPSRDECLENPRARSAKLRVFQRGAPDEK